SADDEHRSDQPGNEARVAVLVERCGYRALAALRDVDVVAPRVVALLLHDDLVVADVDRTFPARRTDGFAVDLDRRAVRLRHDDELALRLIGRELQRDVDGIDVLRAHRLRRDDVVRRLRGDDVLLADGDLPVVRRVPGRHLASVDLHRRVLWADDRYVERGLPHQRIELHRELRRLLLAVD